MKKIVILCTLVLTVVMNINLVNASEIKEVYKMNGSASQVAEYFCNNLDLLEDDYIQYGYDVSLDTCVIHEVTIKSDKKNEIGYMVDLNDSNGYFLIGDNFKIYDMNFMGDSYIDANQSENLIFDVFLGYNVRLNDDYIENIENTPTNTSYSGTTTSGVIIDALDYIQDRYGSDFSLNSSVINFSGTATTMGNASVYLEDSLYTEGNCGLVGAYNFLADLKQRENLSALPSSIDSVLYEPSIMEPSVYNDRLSEGGYYIYTGSSAKSFSSLYITSRLAAIGETGDIANITLAQSKDILEDVVFSNGYLSSEVSFINSSIPSLTTIRNHFDAGETMVYSVLGHSVYGNHTMFATGYQVYVANRTFLGIPYVDYKYLITLRNGWQNYETYLDFSCFAGLYGIITANVNLVGSCWWCQREALCVVFLY